MNSIVRIGKVSSVNTQAATVKVTFSDMDGVVSTELPILFPQTLKNKFYAIPDIGENALCVFLEQGISDGFCVGYFYTESDLPPVINEDKVHYAFEDGTFIEYDRKEHKLKADIKGDAEIKVKNIRLEAEKATLEVKDILLNCTTLSIRAEEDISIQSGSQITLKGKTQTEVIL